MFMGYYDGLGYLEVKEILDYIFKIVLVVGKFFGMVVGMLE